MDPYFDVLAARVRGSDFGDDAELLAGLERRQRKDPRGLEGKDWLLSGVLHHRRGDEEAAMVALERAVECSHAVALARYMQAQIHLTAGRWDDAERSLDAAAEANADQPLLPAAEMIHARGTLALGRSDTEDGLRLYRRALELDAESAGRWQALGTLLLDRGEVEAARDALLQAADLVPDDPECLYLSALARSACGDIDEAGQQLEQVFARDPRYRGRAKSEPRLSECEPLRPILHGPDESDLAWLDELTPWLADLRRDDMVSRLGLRWMSQAQSRELVERLRGAHGRGPRGTMHTPATLSVCRDILARTCPIAWGPISMTRERVAEPMLLLVDLDAPDEVWLALSEDYPPFLWIDVSPTPSALLEELSMFFPRPKLRRVDMSARVRGFMGYRGRFGVPSPYVGDLEPAGVVELDRHFAVNPFVEMGSWGSQLRDDPWPDQIAPQPDYEAKVAARQKVVAQQAQGAVWSLTRRTRHSRSYLGVELHHQDIFVADVRYRPADHGRVVNRMNGYFGCDYPEDMPVDVVAALLGFQFDAVEDLVSRLDATAQPEEIAGLLTVLSSLGHSDLGMVRYYRRYMDHPEAVVRTTLCNIFVAHNHESLLEEMCLIEPDVTIRRQIEPLLDDGIGVATFDPYASSHRGVPA